MAENTLVVFSSDHGEMLGNHQQLLKGPQLYDDLTRVPLIARWPREIAPGAEVSELVQWIDLPATFLAASGCAPAAGGQGASLLPLARGQAVDWRSWALCEYRYSGFATDPLIMTTMLRHGDWKLIVSPAELGLELFALARDPGERQNRAGLHPEVTGALHARLAAWQEQQGRRSAAPAEVTPEVQERLRALGYVD